MWHTIYSLLLFDRSRSNRQRWFWVFPSQQFYWFVIFASWRLSADREVNNWVIGLACQWGENPGPCFTLSAHALGGQKDLLHCVPEACNNVWYAEGNTLGKSQALLQTVKSLQFARERERLWERDQERVSDLAKLLEKLASFCFFFRPRNSCGRDQ